jgi:hypothetical protein
MAANNNVRVEGNYSAQWKSIHSDIMRKYYLPEIYKTYGKSFGLHDFLNMTGKKGLVPKRTVSFFEKGNIKANITLSAAIATGSLGAAVNIKLDSADYDSSNNPVLRIGQTVYIPQRYQGASISIPQAYQVVSSSGTAGDLTFVARPFNSTAAQIVTEVPIGTKLTLGPIQFAPGTGLPTGTTQSLFERSFTSTILKERLGIEGGFLSDVYWEPLEINGEFNGYINHMLIDTEFLLDDQLNSYILLGQKNDNAALTQTSNWGGVNKVQAGDGLWSLLDQRGQKLNYTGTFENVDYVTAKNLLESQGVATGEVIFAMGSKLYDDTDQGDLDFIKEYSGGSDLIMNACELGMRIQTVNRSGIKFHKVKLQGFSDTFNFGNDEYELSSAGFMMPAGKVKVSGSSDGSKPMMFNNVELRFLGNGQENRTRVIGHLKGLTGIQDAAPITSVYDGMDVGMLTEPILLFTEVNKCIQIIKE